MTFLWRMRASAVASIFALAASAAPTGNVSGGISGAAWNHPYGSTISCGYNQSSLGACGYGSAGILTESSSAGDNWSGTINTFQGYATSSIDDIGLHAKVQTDVAGYPLDKLSWANHYGSSYLNEESAQATMFDTLTLNGAGNSPVGIVFKIGADGQILTFNSSAYAKIDFWDGPTYTYNYDNLDTWYLGLGMQTQGGYLSIADTYTHTIWVTPGQSRRYQLSLTAKVNVSDALTSARPGPRLSNVSAVADFDDTLKFDTIGFIDGQGHPLSGYSLSSTSGYNYNQFVGQPTPEPSFFVPVAASLLGAVVYGRARRRSHTA